jgi:hypothetical protein
MNKSTRRGVDESQRDEKSVRTLVRTARRTRKVIKMKKA